MSSRGDSHHAQWMCWTLAFAGIYNLFWGALAVLFPLAMFHWMGMEPPNYPALWQCIGMLVGVYGVGYLVAASDPIWHWPIVLVGLLGKVLGPMGFIRAAILGDLPWVMGWTIVFNDLIWWVPFAIILWKAWGVRIGCQEAKRAMRAREHER